MLVREMLKFSQQKKNDANVTDTSVTLDRLLAHLLHFKFSDMIFYSLLFLWIASVFLMLSSDDVWKLAFRVPEYVASSFSKGLD